MADFNGKFQYVASGGAKQEGACRIQFGDKSIRIASPETGLKDRTRDWETGGNRRPGDINISARIDSKARARVGKGAPQVGVIEERGRAT